MRNLLLATMAFLSWTTMAMAETTYEVSFAKPTIEMSDGISVRVGPGVAYNRYYGNSWLMHFNGLSWIEVTFDKPIGLEGPGTLSVTHLASTVNGNENYSPVTFTLNGRSFLDQYNPNCGNYINDQWDISGWLVEGKNTLRISLGNDALCNYWIQRLAVSIGS